MLIETFERAGARVGLTPRHGIQETVRAFRDANEIKPTVVGRPEDCVCLAKRRASIIESRKRQTGNVRADRYGERMRLERATEDAFKTVA
jgi:hypothetical protein